MKLADEYEIDRGRIYKWVKKYHNNGIEVLELEIMKKDIEIA